MSNEIAQPQDLDKCGFLRQKFMTNIGSKAKMVRSPVIDSTVIFHRNAEAVFGGRM
jgi:hypothetical protein